MMDTLKGIIPLIPWSLAKENKLISRRTFMILLLFYCFGGIKMDEFQGWEGML